MNENKDKLGTYFIVFLRVLIVVWAAMAATFAVYLVAQDVPIGGFFSVGDIMIVLGSFLLIYPCFGLFHHKERNKQNLDMLKGHADGSNAEVKQQAQTIFDSPEKGKFWFGVCCGAVSTAVLLRLLFDRVLSDVFFS